MYCTTHEAGACYEGCPDAYDEPRSTKAKLRRTNEKPEQTSFLGRTIDLPEYDVVLDGEVIGRVVARLVRESMHYSSGSVRVWYAKTSSGKTLGAGLANKNDARDRVVAERS